MGAPPGQRELRAAARSVVPGSAARVPQSDPRREPPADRRPALSRASPFRASHPLECCTAPEARGGLAARLGPALRRLPELSRACRAARSAPPTHVRTLRRRVRGRLGRGISCRGVTRVPTQMGGQRRAQDLTRPRTRGSLPAMSLFLALPVLLLVLLLIGPPGDRGALATQRIDLQA